MNTPSALLRPNTGLLDPTAATLAMELAQDIDTVENILRRYGFEDGERDPRWHALANTREFAQTLSEAITEWRKADSTGKRVRLKSMVMLEYNLPRIQELINSPAAGSAIEALKLIKGLAGMDGPSAGGAGDGGGGFSVTINIGQGKTIKVEKTPTIDGVSERVEAGEDA